MIRQCLTKAINHGVRLLDTSYSDNCERIVGDVLRERLKNIYTREEYIVIAKLPPIGNRRNDVKRFLMKSLRNLNLTYVDIYLIESPVGFIGKHDYDVDPRDSHGHSVLDMDTDLITLWKGMERQHRKGRARFIGVCNFNVEQIGRIIARCKIKPSFAMMDINVYNHRVSERKWLYENSINPLAILPYGNPDFTANSQCPPLPKHPVVHQISQKYKVPTKTVLIKYLVQRDVITLFQSTGRKTLANILKGYHKLNLIQRDLVDLAGEDQNGLARLKDFIDYEGCRGHPEFPFLYDIRTDGVMAGPWMTCSKAEPLPSEYDWLTNSHRLPRTVRFKINNQDDPSSSTKGHRRFTPKEKCSSSKTSKITGHLTAAHASSSTGEETMAGASCIRPTGAKRKSTVDGTNKKRKAKKQNDVPPKKKKVVNPRHV